jgi:hypothetical protein
MKAKPIMLVAVSIILLSSCKKEVNTPASPNPATTSGSPFNRGPIASNEFNVSMNNNLLSFKTSDDYESLVNNPDAGKEQRFQQVVSGFAGYKSHNAQVIAASKQQDDPYRDELFGTILNSDDAVEIGDHIYKIDMPKEQVFVLPSIHADQYPDLLGEKTSNPNVEVFGTHEEVLDLVKTGGKSNPRWSIFCTEPWEPYQPASALMPNGNLVSAWHLDAGIFYSTAAAITTSSVNVYRFDVDFLYYKVRCGSSTGPMQQWNQPGTYDILIPGQKLLVYRGIHNLSRNHFHVRGRDNSTQPPKYSPWLLVRFNS